MIGLDMMFVCNSSSNFLLGSMIDSRGDIYKGGSI